MQKLARSMWLSLVAPAVMVGVFTGCGNSKPDESTNSSSSEVTDSSDSSESSGLMDMMPDLAGLPGESGTSDGSEMPSDSQTSNGSSENSTATNTNGPIAGKKEHTIDAVAVREKFQSLKNGKWEKGERIVLQLDIIGEQAGDALNYTDLVFDEVIVDGNPASIVKDIGDRILKRSYKSIERGPSRGDGQSPKDRFATDIRIKAAMGAKKIDRVSGRVKLELPGKDWIRITDFTQGPIQHPKLAAMNVTAAMYRPHSTIVGVEFPREPKYLRARLVDADGNDLDADFGTGRRKDAFLITFSPGQEIPKGAAVVMTFSPLPIVEIPFVVENLVVKSAKQAARERSEKQLAAAKNFKSTATGAITIGGDKFVIKDVFVTNKRIFPNDYTVLLFDFPLTEKDREMLTKKGSFVASSIANKKRSPTPDKWEYAVIELNIDFERKSSTRKLKDVEDGSFRIMAKRIYPGTMEKEEMLKRFQDINLDKGILTVKSKSSKVHEGIKLDWDFQIQCMPVTEQ